MTALIAAILSRAAGATSFETRTSTAAIGASATSATVVAAAIAAAAGRPLEGGARIAADARGIPREIFTRFGGAAEMGSARFSGKQDDLLPGGNRFGRRFTGRSFDCFDAFLLSAKSFGSFASRFCVSTQGRGMLGAFVRGVGFRFGALGLVLLFD